MKVMSKLVSISCAVFVCCGIARAESVFNWLEPMDQNVGDVNSLGISLRVVEQGLTVPAGFHGLYRVRNQENLLIRERGRVRRVSAVCVPNVPQWPSTGHPT